MIRIHCSRMQYNLGTATICIVVFFTTDLMFLAANVEVFTAKTVFFITKPGLREKNGCNKIFIIYEVVRDVECQLSKNVLMEEDMNLSYTVHSKPLQRTCSGCYDCSVFFAIMPPCVQTLTRNKIARRQSGTLIQLFKINS